MHQRYHVTLQSGRPRKQRGQVIPMTVIFIAAVLLSLWVMYDSGQIMTEKIRLQNTVDSVAYSSATLVARDLNFIAYTNRAMVANQVAIGQMVGLSSWAAMMKTMGRNLDYFGTLVAWVPGIGQAIKAYTQAVKQATKVLANITDEVAEEVIPLNDEVIRALSAAQQTFHRGMQGTIPRFGRRIARRNDPQARPVTFGLVGPGAAFANWSGQIGQQYDNPGRYGPRLAKKRYAEFEKIINQSRDPFSRRRSYHMGHPLSGPGYDTEKRGGSDLIRSADPYSGKYEWDWTAMDTVSLDVEIGKTPFGCALCFHVPLGWGAAHALQQTGRYFNYDPSSNYGEEGQAAGGGQPPRCTGRDCRVGGDKEQPVRSGGQGHRQRVYPFFQSRRSRWGSAWDNDNAAELASYEHARHDLTGSDELHGLQPFYAFRDSGQAHDYGPGIIVLYEKDAADMALAADTAATRAGILDTGTRGSFITAAAKARPYFARPTDLAQFARLDGRYEYGNLYNPFWQPRLVKLSSVEKTALMAAGLAAAP